jgi:FtsP/CotA-like multicopper oxidase with cupredoxin domain
MAFKGRHVKKMFSSPLNAEHAMHAREYVMTIPATQPPGTYFFHSHAHRSG